MRNTRKTLLSVALLLALLAALAGCATAPAPTATPAATATVTATATAAPTAEATATVAAAAPVVDFLGNQVKLDKVPERIVSLSPANTEIIYALGLEGKLVGVDAGSDYPEAAKAIEKVGDFNGPNLEAIAAAKPDLVLAGNKLQADSVKQIQTLGLPVAAVEATTYADIYKSIEMVGALTGAADKAAALTADMKAKEKKILDSIASAPKGTKVFFAMSYGDDGNWTGGPGSFPYELIEMCGGKNLTEGFPVPWVNYTQEDLVKNNPDIILFSSDLGDPAKFKTADAYKDLKAVKDGKVFVVTSNLCMRPGPRIVDGLKEFAEFISGTKITLS